MSEINLRGSIDLLKLENVFTKTFEGKTKTVKCLCIPIEDNDIYMTDDNGKATHAFLGLHINQRRETSQYGKTHYCKQSLSTPFIEFNKELAEKKNGIYLGDFAPYTIESKNAVNRIEAPVAELTQDEKDDLPF